MANPKIFVFAPNDESGDNHPRLESYGCELILGDANWHTPQGNNEEEMVGLAKGTHALMGTSIRSSPITRGILEASPELRIVAKCTVGTDDIDVDAATELGILVTHGPTESNCYGVAEGTVAMILNRLKKLNERDASVKAGQWRDPALMGRYLGARSTDGYSGLTLGIIGLGRIGARVSQLFQPWGMRIIANDPFIDDQRFEQKGAEKVEIDYLLQNSDIVTLHCTHNRTTDKFMNAERFAKMKPDALFINTSRGGNVDEGALAEALKENVIGGAAIDAFADEPLSMDSPLRDVGDKISMSAHMVASNMESGLGPGYQWATQAVLEALNGTVPNNVFNPEVIEKWKERFGGVRSLPSNREVEPHPGFGPTDP